MTTTKTPLPAPTKESASEIAKRTVALVLTFSGIGNRRKVSTSEVEVKADKEWIAVSKQLIDAEELDAIATLDGQCRTYIDSRALPSLLKKGVYLLPTAFVEEVNERLTYYATKRSELVDKLLKVYSSLVEEAERRLRDLFDRSDYPTPEYIRSAFRLQWQYIEWNTPTSLQRISREIYEEERRKAEAAWNETREVIQQLLRAELQEWVNHLIDKLTPDDQGKKKIFRETSIGGLQEFLATFDARNITNDAEMKAVVDQAKSIIMGLDADTLRQSRRIRESVRDNFSTIKKMLDPMIVEKPKRSISLDD